MYVETLTVAAGPPDSYRFRSGEILNIPDDEAKMLLEAGAVRKLATTEPKPVSKPKASVKAADIDKEGVFTKNK